MYASVYCINSAPSPSTSVHLPAHHTHTHLSHVLTTTVSLRRMFAGSRGDGHQVQEEGEEGSAVNKICTKQLTHPASRQQAPVPAHNCVPVAQRGPAAHTGVLYTNRELRTYRSDRRRRPFTCGLLFDVTTPIRGVAT